MRILLAPILALVLSMGFRPGDFRLPTGIAPSREAGVSARESACIPDWKVVDELVGIKQDLVYPVKVTGYSSTFDQCDADPFITASNKHVRAGIIALSRDLLRRYNPDAPFHWGDRIYLEGFGELIVEDSMNARYTQRADIWFPDRKSASRWGVRNLKLYAMPPDIFSL